MLAPNAGVYTLDGTNTWIVGSGPTFVIDPGPDMPEHLADVAREAGSVGAVLVTHDHPDHAPGAIPFARLVGAPVYAFRLMGATKLSAGQRVRAGDLDLTAIHTPGHTSDHVAFSSPAVARCSRAIRCSGEARASSTRPTGTSSSTCGHFDDSWIWVPGRSTRVTALPCSTLATSWSSTSRTETSGKRRSCRCLQKARERSPRWSR